MIYWKMDGGRVKSTSPQNQGGWCGVCRPELSSNCCPKDLSTFTDFL
jgi:hypothetical protein